MKKCDYQIDRKCWCAIFLTEFYNVEPEVSVPEQKAGHAVVQIAPCQFDYSEYKRMAK